MLFKEKTKMYSRTKKAIILAILITIIPTASFAKAKQVHNNKFNYSNVNYVNSSTKVEIICPIHGVFMQWPPDHLQGIGCSKCSGNYLQTKEEYIDTFNKKYSNS